MAKKLTYPSQQVLSSDLFVGTEPLFVPAFALWALCLGKKPRSRDKGRVVILSLLPWRILGMAEVMHLFACCPCGTTSNASCIWHIHQTCSDLSDGLGQRWSRTDHARARGTTAQNFSGPEKRRASSRQRKGPKAPKAQGLKPGSSQERAAMRAGTEGLHDFEALRRRRAESLRALGFLAERLERHLDVE